MSLFLFFLILLTLGVPIAIAMGVVPFVYVIFSDICPNCLLGYKMYDSVDSFTLIAVPLFMLGGNLVSVVGMTQKIINFADQIVGRIRGGLSHVNVLVSTILGGLNGSAVADVAAVGAILIKPMKKNGMKGSYAAAVTSVGGAIAAIIPPSIPFIIYATSVGDISIGALFVGGILPGICICCLMIVTGYIISVKRGVPKSEGKFEIKKFFKASIEASPALILVAIVIIGLRGGMFTPTEAGSIIVFYSLFVGIIIYKNLTLKILTNVLKETAVMTGVVFLVISAAGPFMWVLTRIGSINSLTDFFINLTTNPVLWWIGVFIFLLVAGMIMDTVANLIILSPIVYEAAKSMGFDPFVSSLVIAILMILGTVTPPVGVSLFVSSAIAEESIEDTGKEAIPFVCCVLFVLVIMLLFPNFTKFVPRLFGYQL